MSRIAKSARYEHDAVVLDGSRSRQFCPATFSREAPATAKRPDDAAVQRAMLETARSHAERILAQAEEQASAVLREAMVRGYADGKAEGLAAAQEECGKHLARLAELVRRARVDRDAMVRDAKQELAALAVAIAARVIHREVTADPATVLSIVEAALEKAGTVDSVRVLLHPDDVGLVREKWSDLKGALAFGDNWEVVGSDQVDRGGCLIETRAGTVDARIESQLSRISTAFQVEP
mgnify:CR=1 FL=1